ncbi:MAG TPA: nuclease-related domain-containing protein [Woeseiaceae bacterium]
MLPGFCISLGAGIGALAVASSASAGEAMAAAPGATDIATGLSNFGVSATIITIACILLLVLLFRGSASRITRFVGEKRGKRRLRRALRRRSRDVLEDVLLPGAYGGLTRVDYVILTSGGILCIRAKHCNGTVFGSDEDPQWKNVDGIYQQKFLNPAIQNAGRARALQNIVPDVPVASLVVFTGSVQLAAPKVRNVIHVRDLDSYISKFVFGPCKIKDWDAVWLTVRAAILTDEGSRKDFRAQLSFS